MPPATRSSNPNTPSKPNTKFQASDTITPPSAEVNNSSPPSAPKSISVRGRKRIAGQEPKSDSPSELSRSAKKRRVGGRTGAEEAVESIRAETEGEVEIETVVERKVVVVDTQTRAKKEDAEEDAGPEAEAAEGSEAESASASESDEEGAQRKKRRARAKGKDKSKDPSTPKRKRKTKKEKEAEAMPLAARTTGLKMFVGAHVSIAKGLENSVTNSVHIGGNAFALFLKSQRKWENKALQDENRDLFRKACTDSGYDAASHVLPHGSYLVNLAQEEPAKAKQAYDAFLDDLQRCEALGIKLYNFHPGVSGSSTPAQAITRIANALNKALSATSTVVPVLENMAGSGTVIGGTFESLGSVISQIAPEHKHRIGVCIDTCHSFAAGYDLRNPKSFAAVLDKFDESVGMKYLKALHLNDSKAPLGSHRDLHAKIGTGFLGLRAFHNVMNEPRFENLPLILETPIDRPDPSDATGKKTLEDKGVWAREIKLLESLIGMDVEGEEFKDLEKELSEMGRAEREKMQVTFDKKVEGEKKKLLKKEKGQGTLSWEKAKGKEKEKEKGKENGVEVEDEGHKC